MIYPHPQKLTEKEGFFKPKRLNKPKSLVDFAKSAEESDEIKFEKKLMLDEEEYILDVCPDGIMIAYSACVGKFRALTSLYQLFFTSNCSKIACVYIEDKPDFKRRGYMLDISRCRMPKLDTIKDLVDSLALLKYNELQLYMEDFCFKYPLLPKATEGINCLTPEDICELDKYCAERHIDLVPNQNCLGHMKKWLSRDEYKHLAVGAGVEPTGTINPLLDESRQLVDDIFDSLLPYFSSGYVNVGLDEAYGLGKYELEQICRERGIDGFFMDYLCDINERIGKKYGKRLQFWADMIINYPESFKRIPKGAIAMEWGYELIQSQLMAEHCAALRDKGADFYVCPSCNTHFSFTGRFDVTSFNLRTAGEVGKKYGAMGYLLTDWGMGYEGHPHFGVWSFIPAALGGQYAWNTGEEQNGENFKVGFIRGAMNFVDTFRFGGVKISDYLYRASNYYLLEPDRIHCGTMCGQLFPFPLEKTGYFHLFDLKNYRDVDFYFNNLIRYMNEIMEDIRKIDFDSDYKREILVNMKSVVLSAELCKVRVNKKLDSEHAKRLIADIDEIYGEFSELWRARNYERGIECFQNVLNSRRAEISEYVI